jgi:hypothetical protein
MIDDRLDGQLQTLGRVVATAAPRRAEIAAIAQRNRHRRARARRVAGALATVVVVGTSALAFTVLDRDRDDVTADLGVGPDVAGPDAAGGNEAVASDVGGDDGCDLAGPDAASESFPDHLRAVGDALEERFPSCFGGIARTGPSAADLWVVDLAPEVKQAAQEMLGPDFLLTALPSDHALADVRAVKAQIDDNAAQLHSSGIPVAGTGIRLVTDGPRVLVGLSPYTREGVEQLEALYGDDVLLIDDYGAVIPG